MLIEFLSTFVAIFIIQKHKMLCAIIKKKVVKLKMKKMKKKNVTIALIAFLLFTGVTNLFAQTTTPTEKKPFGEWLTKTPWIVSFGADIVDDNNDPGSIFHNLKTYQYYPAKFTAEKVLVKGWSAQFAFGSTSLNRHNFLMVDANAKYSFLYKKASKFDPFAIIGLGYTYRDHSVLGVNSSEDKNNSFTFHTGLGANLWLYPNMGLTAQGLAKFTKDKFLQASIGMVFRIGGTKAPECTVTPKTKEAEDALQHLRGIINK